MTKPAKWSFGDKPPAPEPQEWEDTETYEDQQNQVKEPVESVRAYDERGNVRPADKRFTDNPEGSRKKSEPAKKTAAKKTAAKKK